jgi:AraC-like DNA-binding protein/quercetin dioxygenase-like cupin family protein
MTVHQDPQSFALRSLLTQRLAPIAAQVQAGFQTFGPQLTTYCCLKRERIAAVVPPHPLLGIVLRGRKEIWLGDACQSFEAGAVFVMPRGVPMDVVNILDDRSGHYAALILEVKDLPESLLAGATAETGTRSLQIPLTRALVDALSHAAGVTEGGAQGEAVQRLRLAEVLTLLQGEPAARPLFHQSLADRVVWLIRSDPARNWRVCDVAETLAMGASTLRRRLDAQGTPFRSLLRQTRMAAAQHALASGAAITSAAEAAGYASRSHFARQFRAAFGTSPSGRAS